MLEHVNGQSRVQKVCTSVKRFFSVQREVQHTTDCKETEVIIEDNIKANAKQNVSGIIDTQLFLAESSEDLQVPSCDICDEDEIALNNCRNSATVELPHMYSPAFKTANDVDKEDKLVMKKQNESSKFAEVFTSVKSFFSKKKTTMLSVKNMTTKDHNDNHIPSLADQKIADAINTITTNLLLAESKESLMSIDLEDDEDFNSDSILNEPGSCSCSCISLLVSIKKTIVHGFRTIFRTRREDELACKGEATCNV